MQSIINKSIVVLLIACVLCSLVAGCTAQKPQPEDTIKVLQESINHFDVDRFLTCIDSAWANRIESFLSLTMSEDGMSVESFIDLIKKVMPVLPFVSKGAISSDDLPQVAFTVLKTDISGDTATVVLSGIMTWGAHTKPFAATVDMKIENESWVICGIS